MAGGQGRRKKRQPVLIFVFLFGFLLAAFASWQLLSGWREDANARREYAALRESIDLMQPGTDRLDMSGFIEQNSDFVGWIMMGGTSIDYPVVQAADNAAYLRTTFLGQANPAGSIFMDYRAVRGFDSPLTILYGHNMRDGSMFAPLHQFADVDFAEDYHAITIITAAGEILMYRVFDVRAAEAQDAVYALDPMDSSAVTAFFGDAPEETGRFLVLSTCADASNRDGRLLIFAVYVRSA
ncbi:MAG: class B sortase [Oscillospiraceae bacterium]|nr:class B sortase [Oscillospiraceae bacterium]